MSNTTLLLDGVSWDLLVDANGNIAVASDPYALAQDAASAIRLFLGELYFDTSQGVPYWQQILGKMPPVALMKAKFVSAALTVPGVVSATCFITSWTDRQVSGQVQVTNAQGVTAAAAFASLAPAPPTGSPSLDFSDPSNSQYLPLLPGL